MFHEINRFRPSMRHHPTVGVVFWTLQGEVRWGVDVAFLWRLTAALAGCNWLGNPPLPGSLTAWAQKIQTTGRNPLCLPAPTPSLTRLETQVIFHSSSLISVKFYQRKPNYYIDHWDCQRNRLSFQPWDLNNLFSNDNSFKMKFTVWINLIPHQA